MELSPTEDPIAIREMAAVFSAETIAPQAIG